MMMLAIFDRRTHCLCLARYMLDSQQISIGVCAHTWYVYTKQTESSATVSAQDPNRRENNRTVKEHQKSNDIASVLEYSVVGIAFGSAYQRRRRHKHRGQARRRREAVRMRLKTCLILVSSHLCSIHILFKGMLLTHV